MTLDAVSSLLICYIIYRSFANSSVNSKIADCEREIRRLKQEVEELKARRKA